ncbi:hypothetical protein N7478_006131 [Penicillium angulare]|uniref:uncharacterized protein n=1 Tax=Penicillium angulare TaxID=116970 RepID=UPI002541EF06|nr:uncharacterized protein N7478_006131 [Penicillium angulare]KAJ5280759.1 hypothetical protein N7478_006131 [Penicillium angulare]
MLSWVYPTRIVQALLALATIGLAAFGATSPFSNVIYFLLFNGCWTTVIAVPYLGLAPLWFPRFSHEFVIPAVEFVTMGLWLAGWIATAALLPKPSSCNDSYCQAQQAQIVIAAIEWALFLLTNVFAFLDVKNSRFNRRTHEQSAAEQTEQTETAQVDAAQAA